MAARTGPQTVDVEVINMQSGLPYKVHETYYEPDGTYYRCVYPKPHVQFGIRARVLPNFIWDDCTHLRVTFLVDNQYVAAKYLLPQGRRSVVIQGGRKMETDTRVDLRFVLITGDVHNPSGSNGNIQVKFELGVKDSLMKPRRPRANDVKETVTHDEVEPIELPPRPARTQFVRVGDAFSWYFRYAHKRFPDEVASTTEPFSGLGKRDRDKYDEEDLDERYWSSKRPRTSGLEGELSRSGLQQNSAVEYDRVDRYSRISHSPAPRELFPENNGVTYNNGSSYDAKPFYGRFQ